MKTWLDSHALLVISLVALGTILIWATEEVLWIIRDERGSKWPRAARQVLRACAYLLTLMLLTGFGWTLGVLLIGWDWELWILAVSFLCAAGTALMGFVILPRLDGERKP